MKKTLFDANVIIDVLLKRKGLYDGSALAMSCVEQKKVKGYICVTSIPLIHYVVEKGRDKKEADFVIKRLTERFSITHADGNTVRAALNAGFSDFEDAIIYRSALKSGVDYIVTRDKKGFKSVEDITVISPEELLGVVGG